MEKEKAISESTVNSQRIGITLRLETVRKLCQFKVKKEFYWCSLFHVISESEIIHILMYFAETRQLGLEQELAKYGNASKNGQWNFKHDPLQQITFRCFKYSLTEKPMSH